jgi:hypothetical protein
MVGPPSSWSLRDHEESVARLGHLRAHILPLLGRPPLMVRHRFESLFSFVLNNSLLLLVGAVVASGWANLDLTN